MVPPARICLASLVLALTAGLLGAQPQPAGTALVWGWNGSGQLGDAPAVQRSVPFEVPGVGSLRSIAAGMEHVLARRSDGTVWAWGGNSFGQLGLGDALAFHESPSQVPALTGVVAIAAGAAHSLALLADGTVRAWGNNGSGRLGDGTTTHRIAPVQVVDLDGVMAIAAGHAFSVALKTDGTVWSWGRGDFGQLGTGAAASSSVPVAVAGLTSVVGIAAGGRHAVAVKDDGTVWTWGLNDYGQLGDGTTSTRLAPVQVPGLTGVVQAAAGFSHSLAALSDGSVRAWGRNDAGQLGNGVAGEAGNPVPVQTEGPGNVTAVAGGSMHSLARRADGTVWAWGYDELGQCGGTFTNNLTPVLVAGISGATVVSAGWDFSAAVSVDGAAWVWGSNASGQHGDGSPVAVALPRILPAVPALTKLTASVYHSLALDAGGGVWSWGAGGLGETGHGQREYVSPPSAVGALAAARDIAAGFVHSLAVTTDGAIWAWGGTSYGPIGIPGGGGASTPTLVPGLGDVVAVTAGAGHSAAVTATGQVWAWGDNSAGQIGDGTNETRPTPVLVPGLSDIVSVTSEAVASHTLALAGDGTVWSWGSNDSGQLGDGTRDARLTPFHVPGLTGVVAIAALGGQGSSFALADDGILWAWGANNRGQLGDGSTTRRLTPAPVPGLVDVTAVSAGDGHVIAATGDGRAWTWGYNYAGQLGLGDFADRWSPARIPNLTGVFQVFAGGDNTAVLAACELGCTADVPAAGEPDATIPFSSSFTTTSGCVTDPTFDWDFGDGSAHSSEQDPSHAYAVEGTYHWVLTVTLDDKSCTSEGDITITFPCTVSCSAAAPSYAQAGAAAAFTSSATLSHCAAAATIDWDFGDGSANASDASPSHAYAAPGIYNWTFTATANGASCVRSGTITVLGPACTGAYDLIIPAAAHSNNAWQSDLDLYNVGADPASVDIALLKPGQANLAPSAMNVAVLPGQTLRIPDILGSLLPAANAALGIRFCSGSALVNSRFYNIGTAKTGTFGAIVPAVPPSAAVTPTTRGVFHHLTYSTDPKTGYRVNLGFANASPFSVSVTARLYGDDGSLIGTKTLSVRAFEQSRLDKIHQTLATGPVSHGAMTVEVNTPNALLHAYALLIDNVSNDPAFMPVELVPR